MREQQGLERERLKRHYYENCVKHRKLPDEECKKLANVLRA